MLDINRRIISYICPECGLPVFKNLSLFLFSGKRELQISCSCKKSHLTISTNNHKKYFINVPCFGCGNFHTYTLGFHKMWETTFNSICCTLNSTEILFWGIDNEVIKRLDNIEEQKDEIAKVIGYEKIFSNSTIMLEMINKVHQFCENKSIICECGNDEFDIEAKKDKIFVTCRKCNSTGRIRAKSSYDLKKMLDKETIVIYINKQYI